MKAENQNKLAIIIASCDKYADLWESVVSEFNKKWEDCPYNIYLVSNQKKYSCDRVQQVLVGEDVDWSTTMQLAVQKIDEDYILFWLDDVFLDSSIDTCVIAKHFEWMFENEADFLRLRANPRPKEYSGAYGKLSTKASYRVSIFATIWKKNVFLDLVSPGESAWEFELIGTTRSTKYEKFYAVRRDCFKYRHGVEKGKWIPSTYRWLSEKGYALNDREVMTRKESIYSMTRKLKSKLLDFFPEDQRRNVLVLANKLYRATGLRN